MITTPPFSDSYCEQLLRELPQLREKVLVDMVNGVSVSREHIRVQRKRNGSFQRFVDGLTGTGARRQAELNENLAVGISGAIDWLKALEAAHVKSDVGIARMSWSLKKLADRLHETRDVVVGLDRDVKQLVADVQDMRYSLENRLRGLEGRVSRLEWIRRAEIHLKRAINDWHEGKHSNESLLTQVFLVADGLYWGEFGAACILISDERNDAWTELREWFRPAMRQEISSRLGLNSRGSDSTRSFPLTLWRQRTDGPDRLDGEVLSYLGDWTAPENQPLSHFATNPEAELSVWMPRILSPAYACDLLQMEIFEGARP